MLYSHHCTIVHLVVTVDFYSVNSSELHTLKIDAIRYYYDLTFNTHSSTLSFRPKTNNQLIKKFLCEYCCQLSKSCQKLDIILENRGVQKLKLTKYVNNKNCAPKMIFFNEKLFLERFGSFLTWKINFESQNFAFFDHFYSTNCKTYKLFNGLIVGLGPIENPGRMCDSVC